MYVAKHTGSSQHHQKAISHWVVLSIILSSLFLPLSCSIDHGLGPTVQGIRGTLFFNGSWPDTILEARVVVFDAYPPTSLLDLKGYSDAIPLLSDTVSYEIELSPGEYPFIVVACRVTAEWDPTCVLGFYHSPDTPETPKSVTVTTGTFAEGIDITVDFQDVAVAFPWPTLPGLNLATKRVGRAR